jgi:hypothetical protein
MSKFYIEAMHMILYENDGRQNQWIPKFQNKMKPKSELQMIKWILYPAYMTDKMSNFY